MRVEDNGTTVRDVSKTKHDPQQPPTQAQGSGVKRHYIATAPDGTEFTRSTGHIYTHAVLVWCLSWRDQVWKWHIHGFCGSSELVAKSATRARQKFLKPDERVEVVKVREFTPLTDRQRAFLLEIGDKTIEMFCTSHLVPLVKRGLVERRFIGMRWWSVRRTRAGQKAVEVAP